ncbi:MAG: hypothetical protein Q8O74_02320 [bacterium]|nr:hypothetical protein [bacterium]
MVKYLFLILALTTGCAVNSYYMNDYLSYNFKKNQTITSNVGAEMLKWSKTSNSGSSLSTFTQALTYTGKQGGVIKISYREFSDNYARPAFSQELTYDITDDSILVFRDIRLGVIDATNRFIRFIVFEHPAFYYTSEEPINTKFKDDDIFAPGSGSKKKQ